MHVRAHGLGSCCLALHLLHQQELLELLVLWFPPAS